MTARQCPEGCSLEETAVRTTRTIVFDTVYRQLQNPESMKPARTVGSLYANPPPRFVLGPAVAVLLLFQHRIGGAPKKKDAVALVKPETVSRWFGTANATYGPTEYVCTYVSVVCCRLCVAFLVDYGKTAVYSPTIYDILQ